MYSILTFSIDVNSIKTDNDHMERSAHYLGLWDEATKRLLWRTPTNRPRVLRQIELASYENANLIPVWVTEWPSIAGYHPRVITRILTGELIQGG